MNFKKVAFASLHFSLYSGTCKEVNTIKKERDFIPATFDAVFKGIFGSQEGLPLTKKLLGGILEDIKEEDIDSIKLLNVELKLPTVGKSLKGRSVDLLLETKAGLINIEMNANNYRHLENRNFLYAISILLDTYQTSNIYKEVVSVIQINLNNFACNSDYISTYMVMNKEQRIKNHLLKIIDVDMALIKKKCYNKDIKELSDFEALVLGITALNSKELDYIKGERDFMEKFNNLVERLNRDGKVIGLYDKEKERDFFGFSVEAEARNDGLEEGLKEGEKRAKKETALALLKANIDIEVIIKATGLTIEEVNELNK